jgi:hypothetical protein
VVVAEDDLLVLGAELEDVDPVDLGYRYGSGLLYTSPSPRDSS